MAPHATIARWDGDRLTSGQHNGSWAGRGATSPNKVGIPQYHVGLVATYVGGGFGGKTMSPRMRCWQRLVHVRLDAVFKVALPWPLMPNKTSRRAATIQRVCLGAGRDGKLIAIGHEPLTPDRHGIVTVETNM
jgi:xanthine dehydrogenase YagR molybdenum-binding subunit